MPEIYVIVADASVAKIMRATDKHGLLNEFNQLSHPEGRLHSRDLTSDLSGHGSNHVGSGYHLLDSESDPKQHENIKFAKTVATYINELCANHKIDQLFLIASPPFLGLLRSELTPNIMKLVTYELNKNLTHLKSDEIRSHIPWFSKEHMPEY